MTVVNEILETAVNQDRFCACPLLHLNFDCETLDLKYV